MHRQPHHMPRPYPISPLMEGVWHVFACVLAVAVVAILWETRTFLEINGEALVERYDKDFYSLFVDALLLAGVAAVHSISSLNWNSRSSVSTCLFIIANIVALKVAISYWTQTSNFVVLHIDVWLIKLLLYLVRLAGWILIAIQVLSRFDLWRIENLPGTPNRTTAHKVTYFRGITLLGAILVLWPVPLLTLDRLMLNVCAAYYIFLSGPVSEVEYDYFQTLMAKSWIANTRQK
eukprot:Phypoly_transcript_16656.p1 GENE.Phypoly_transcript_16656~~Phypoly_transcript_16656.p1  ORF type:complete len:234 (+),score=21.97 Phypoly_transcript_16656:62-763(+)